MSLKDLFDYLLHNIDTIHLSPHQYLIETRIKPVGKESEEEIENQE